MTWLSRSAREHASPGRHVLPTTASKKATVSPAQGKPAMPRQSRRGAHEGARASMPCQSGGRRKRLLPVEILKSEANSKRRRTAPPGPAAGLQAKRVRLANWQVSRADRGAKRPRLDDGKGPKSKGEPEVTEGPASLAALKSDWSPVHLAQIERGMVGGVERLRQVARRLVVTGHYSGTGAAEQGIREGLGTLPGANILSPRWQKKKKTIFGKSQLFSDTGKKRFLAKVSRKKKPQGLS
jgi:hypothetical protein